MVYITGDKHADFREVISFCSQNNTSKEDLMIVLGDAGINYYASRLDNELKEELSKLPITFFCIHGNHEQRAELISTYKEKEYNGGIVYYEDKYPNILFAKSGDTYIIDNKKILVIGGAYSVDKYYRILMNYNWYESEMLTEEEKENILNKIRNLKEIDIILSHTCPYKYLPTEMFISGIDQSKVDNSMEYFLDEVEENIKYNKWYCGHFHTDKKIDKLIFMYHDIREFR